MDKAAQDQNNLHSNAADVGPIEPTQDKQPNDNTEPKSPKITECCTICQGLITTQTIGKPETCEHQFCLICLLGWSKRTNTCPIDRETYKKIFFTNKLCKGELEGFITVRDADPLDDALPVYELTAEERLERLNRIVQNARRRQDVYCSVCGGEDRVDDVVKQCVGCRRGYHSACSDDSPAADGEDWYCQQCILMLLGLVPVENVNAVDDADDWEVDLALLADREVMDGRREQVADELNAVAVGADEGADSFADADRDLIGEEREYLGIAVRDVGVQEDDVVERGQQTEDLDGLSLGEGERVAEE